jgi:L-rhamnose mutarotase
VQDYLAAHQHVWPDMLEALTAAGWRNYSLFLRESDGLVVGYLETDDFAAAQRRMAETESTRSGRPAWPSTSSAMTRRTPTSRCGPCRSTSTSNEDLLDRRPPPFLFQREMWTTSQVTAPQVQQDCRRPILRR